MPAFPGAFSAVGLALAGEATEATEAISAIVTTDTLANILAQGQELLAKSQALLEGKRGRGKVGAMVRYQGQGACLQVPLTRRVANTFVKEHQRRFGFSTDSPIEIVQISARSECPANSLPAAS